MLFIAADRTSGLAKAPRPFVRVKQLADFAVTYELNAYCSDVPAMNEIYTDLHRHILDVFNAYGVQIMTPADEADPAEPKLVPPKDWHLAPAAPPGDWADLHGRRTGAGEGPPSATAVHEGRQ